MHFDCFVIYSAKCLKIENLRANTRIDVWNIFTFLVKRAAPLNST